MKTAAVATVKIMPIVALTMMMIVSACTSTKTTPARGVTPPGGAQDMSTAGALSGQIAATALQQDIRDFNSVSFRASYLTYSNGGALVFSSGIGLMNLTGLPAGQNGTLNIDLYEVGVLKLRGQTALMLQSGTSAQVAVPLQRVDASGNIVAGPAVATIYFNQSVIIPQSPTGQTPVGTQPVAWDGKSDIGTDRWRIETVQ